VLASSISSTDLQRQGLQCAGLAAAFREIGGSQHGGRGARIALNDAFTAPVPGTTLLQLLRPGPDRLHSPAERDDAARPSIEAAWNTLRQK